MTWPINEVQNLSSNLKYLAARRKTFEACNNLIIMSFMMVLGLSCVAFWRPNGNSEAAEILAIFSLIYTLFEASFIDLKIAKTSKQNASLQEKFDCNIFDIDQNPHFAPDLSKASIEADASALSAKKMAKLVNWYESDLGSLPKPVAGFVAQYTSTAYDYSLRQFYLKLLWGLFIALIVCGVIYLVGQNDRFRSSIVVSIVPLVPLFIWLIKAIRSNSELASEQNEALKVMDDAWRQVRRGVLKGPALKEAVRDSQDALYFRRASPALIFPGIYRLRRSALEGRAARTAASFRAEYEAANVANSENL